MWVALVLYGLLTAWSHRWVSGARASYDSPQRDVTQALDIAQALVAPLLGPFLGPFAQHWRPCSLEDSHAVFVGVSAIALGLGLALQVLPLPAGRGWSRLRLFFWSTGWTVWFGAGMVSLAHRFG